MDKINETRLALDVAWAEIEKMTGIPIPSIFVRTKNGPFELLADHFYHIVSDSPHQYTRLVHISKEAFYTYIDMVFGDAGLAYIRQLVTEHPTTITEVSREYWDRAQTARNMYLAAIRAIDKNIEETTDKQGNGQ